jgi:hypothetical protein
MKKRRAYPLAAKKIQTRPVSVDTKQNQCLDCHRPMDMATGIRRARPGDLSICLMCSGVAVFTTDMGLRRLTPEEEKQAAARIAETRAVLRRVQLKHHFGTAKPKRQERVRPTSPGRRR